MGVDSDSSPSHGDKAEKKKKKKEKKKKEKQEKSEAKTKDDQQMVSDVERQNAQKKEKKTTKKTEKGLKSKKTKKDSNGASFDSEVSESHLDKSASSVNALDSTANSSSCQPSTLDETKGTPQQTKGKTSRKDLFRDLINHDPCHNLQAKTYDDEKTYNFIQQNPKVCQKKYRVDFAKDKLYPLSILCALGASVKTLDECYKAYPQAAGWNDGFVGTAMHYACSYGAPTDVVEFLIDEVRCDDCNSSSDSSRDSDKNSMIWATNHMFRLPIHLACMNQAPLETLKLLIDNYEQGLVRIDKDGMTPLHYVCNHADAMPQVISMLLAKHTKAINVKNKTQGQTPMHLAVQRGCGLEIVEALFLSEPDRVLSITDKDGNIPLHTAALVNADMRIVQFLVWNHADGVAAYNADNDRPVDIARRVHKKNKEMATILDPSG